MTKTMKRLISAVLAVQLVVSAMPLAYADSGDHSLKLVAEKGSVTSFVRLLTASYNRSPGDRQDLDVSNETDDADDKLPAEIDVPPVESPTVPTEPPVELPAETEVPSNDLDEPDDDNEGGKKVGGEISPLFIEIIPAASMIAAPYVWVQYNYGITGLLTAKNPPDYRFSAENTVTPYTGFYQKTLTAKDLSDNTNDWRTNAGAREVRLRFPSLTDAGRVPDMMFEGWYIYGSMKSETGVQPPAQTDAASRKYSAGMYRLKESDGLIMNADGTFEDWWIRDGFEGTQSFDPNNPDDREFGIQFVANWKKSNIAKPAALDLYPLRATGNVNDNEFEFKASSSPLTLYQQDIQNVSDAALAGVAKGFNPNVTDYYVRVDNGVEAVDLSLEAFEPYAEYMAQYDDLRELVGVRDNGNSGATDRAYTYVYSYVNPAVKVDGSKAKASPVQVRLKTGDASNPTVTDFTNSHLNYEMLNGGIYNEYESYEGEEWYNTPAVLNLLHYWAPNNDSSAPARSVWEITAYKSTENTDWWTVPDGRTFDRETTRSYTKSGDKYDIDDSIPLVITEGGNKLYNTIEVTVTAPDGVTTKTYRIHIQRLRDPSAKLLPGNSPIGVIERDQGSTWGTGATAAANKAAYKDAFLQTSGGKQAYQFLKTASSEPHPTDVINNNNGRLFYDVYTTSAWVKTYTANPKKWRGVVNQSPVQGLTDPTGEPLYDYNPDIDENALFVYQDSGFYDPGFAYIYDTQGNVVNIKDSGAVKRSVKLTYADKLDYSLINPNNRSGLKDVWYTKTGELSTTTELEILTTADGRDRIDLTGKNIMPGIYTMEYVFTDPTTGREYDSLGENFSSDNKFTRFEFSRTLVVLPIPGDIDMNGAVTVADAVAYSRLINEFTWGTYLEGTNADTLVAMFARRVVDVNPDGKVLNDNGTAPNEYDYNKIEGGFEPQLSKAGGTSDYFYVPPQPLSDVAVKARSVAMPTVSGGDGRATLTVDFLGSGDTPKSSVAEAADDTVKTNDVFWVGIRLSNTANSPIFTGGAVQNFNFTLNYDNVYVESVSLIGNDDMSWAQDMDPWVATMHKFNLRQGANTIWAPAGSTRNFTHTAAMKPRGVLGNHYSKAVTELEATRGSINVSEMVFSITRAAAAQESVAFKDGYLLVVPFKLKQFPNAPEGSTAKLVEMGMGMREFTFVNTKAAPAQGFSMFGAPIQPYAATYGEAAYSIQSSVDGNGIFGDTTDNLKDSIAYSTYMLGFTLGSDESPRTVLRQNVEGVPRNAVYGDYFDVSNVRISAAQPVGLPPGLSYIPSTGHISGIPTKAGRFTFSVGAIPYEITVEQAPLRVYSDDKVKYYGESQFIGKESFDGVNFLVSSNIANPDFNSCSDPIHAVCGLEHFNLHLTYKYYPCDIKEIDKYDGSGLLPNRGVITDLMTLIGTEGLKHPELYVVDDNNQPIVARTGVGEYKIISGEIDSSKANYKLIYTDYAFDEEGSRPYGYKPATEVLDYTVGNDIFNYESYGQPVGRMTIMRRPLTVGTMIRSADETVGEITDELGSRTLAGLFAQTTARTEGEPLGFTAVMPRPLSIDSSSGATHSYDLQLITSPDGSDNGLMPGDELYITYAAEFQQREGVDVGPGITLKDNKLFSLSQLREKRDIVVRNIVLEEDKGSAANYRLVFEGQASPINSMLTDGGVVVQKPITRLAIISMPKIDLVYGNRLELIGALQIFITNGKVGANDEIEEDSSSVVNYVYGSEQSYGLSISLVTEFQKEMGWYAQPKLKDGVDPNAPGFDPRDLSNYKTVDEFGTLDFEQPLVADDGMILAVAESGYYLCVYATTTSSSNIRQMVTVFSDNAVVIKKKPLTLTPQPKSRYYGEHNGEFDLTFSKYDLSETDRQRLTDMTLNRPGNLAEFIHLFSSDDTYVKPNLYGLVRHDSPVKEIVDELTPYTGAYYHVILDSAVTDNYTIQYTRLGTQQTFTEYGYNNLFVAPRPVIVRTIKNVPNEQATVYADATKLGSERVLNKRNIQLSSTNVEFIAPHTVGASQLPGYYTRTSTTEQVIGNAMFGSLTGTGGLIDDDVLTISADIAFIPDYDRTGGFNNEMFDLEGGVSKDYNIIVQNLRIVESPTANNYVLVFYNPSDGVYGTPTDTQTVYQDPNTKELVPISGIDDVPDFPVLDSEGNPVDPASTYRPPLHYIASNRDGAAVKGRVVLRPLTKIEIIGDPYMKYTYGAEFAPWSQGTGGTRFTVQLTYDNKYANPPAPTQPTMTIDALQYARQSMTSNESSFTNAGLDIFFVDNAGELVGEDAANYDNQFTFEGRYLPVSYTGKYIRVGGRRHADHPYITSVNLSVGKLEIGKRDLPIRVVEQFKYYGEHNKTNVNVAGSTYEFTFLVNGTDAQHTGGLAQPDIDKLNNAVSGGTTGLIFGAGTTAYSVGYAMTNAAAIGGGEYRTGAAQSSALSLIDPGYVGPTFTTNADVLSEVKNNGNSSDYYIKLNGGTMANYNFVVTNSNVRIFRRPIYISSFNSNYADMAGTKAIFTIYNDSGANIYRNDIMYKGIQTEDIGYTWFNPSLPVVAGDGTINNDDSYVFAAKERGAKIANPTGSAIVGSDNIGVTLDITFPANRVGMSSCEVGISKVALGPEAQSGNYWLIERNRTYTGYGKIETRDINNITVLQGPVVPFDSYVYGTEAAKGVAGGGALDLSGLIVRLDYTDSDGQPKVKQINYQGSNNFEAEGLYLRYYPDANMPTVLNDTQREAIHKYRRASSGDHLTIAPTHQSYEASSPYAGGAWTPNGKYVVLYSRVPGSLNPFSNHQYIYAEPRKNDASIQRRSQIQVAPKVLTYTFAAEPKTYDGTDRAVGSITLTNVFAVQDGVVVDDFHTGLKDVVWVTTGATAYERASANPVSADYNNFYNYIKSKGYIDYSFTSGTFADVTNPKHTEEMNGKLDYTGKNPYGTTDSLTFRFLWPNVRYEESGTYTHTSSLRAPANSPLWKTDASRREQKDVYGNVASMPVEISGITLAGPDAANYVFENNTRKISYTYNHGSGAWSVTPPAVYVYDAVTGKWRSGSSQPYPIGDINRIPYAVISKARRADIDVLVPDGLQRPVLETDWHTNVVRVLFDPEYKTGNSVVKRMLAAEAAINSLRVYGNKNTPIADAYESEVPEAHIEYALEYLIPVGANLDDGITAASIQNYRLATMNAAGYQDDMYFGGEAFKVEWPENFAPDLRNVRPPDRNTVFTGQRYKWTLDDENYLRFDKTTGAPIYRDTLWPFDEGFVYTAGDDGGYYETARLPLARDAYVWAKVRLSETHNYLPSEPMYSVDNTDAMSSYYTMSKDSANFRVDIQSAYDYAASRLTLIDANAALNRQEPDEEPLPAAVIKTYKYAMPIVSAANLRSVIDNNNYLVETLEQVWFTDKSYYFDSRQADYVFENDLTRRYREYYWDNLGQNRYEYPLEFGVNPAPGTEITVNREDADRNRYESYENINNGTIDSRGTTLKFSVTGEAATQAAIESRGEVYPIFASTAAADSPIERWIKILPRDIVVELGHEPVTLEVEFWPAIVPRYEITWESNDPAVALVDDSGVLHFNDVGKTLVTATSFFGKQDYIAVTVLPGEEPIEDDYPIEQGTMLDREYTGSYMEVDGNYYFYPERGMTRAEMVVLMAKLFIQQNAPELHEVMFDDLSIDEAYFSAVDMLASAGVVVGVGENLFAAKRLATRAEMAALIARMLELDVAAYEGVELFSDISEDETWAGPHISALADAGITNGVGGGEFRPNRILTRAEAAAFVSRLLVHNTVEPGVDGLTVPVDVSESHWAYDSIIRALNEIILHIKSDEEDMPLE